jgi:DNA mismatch repair protein MLH1
VDILIEHSDMLLEYFSMEVTQEGYLASLPVVLFNYYPNEGKLPHFLLRLGSEVITSLD